MLFSWKIVQLTVLFHSLGVLKSLNTCNTCQSARSDDILVCRCDDQCSTYRDCCPDSPRYFAPPNISDSLRSAINFMKCQSRYKSYTMVAVGDAYYMVSSCPANWTSDLEFAESVENNCTSPLAEFEDFPPVSDLITGITYRNEFCAICHDVNTSTALTWPTRLRCQGTFANISRSENITLELIQMYCPRCSFDPPSNTMIMDTLRWCIPVESQCQPFNPRFNPNVTEYNSLLDSCVNGDYNPIFEIIPFLSGRPLEKIHRNLDCARCNNIDDLFLDCLYPSNSTNDTNSDLRCTNVDGQLILGPLPFSAVLDVTGSGIVRITSSMITEVEVIRCEQNQIFDPIVGCRNIVCPVGFIASSGTCSPNNTISPTTSTTDGVQGNMNDTSGNFTDNDNTNYTINCTTIALNATEYTAINDSFVLFREEVTDVIGYDANGRPIVCVGFNRSGEVTSNITVTRVSYPVGFIELTYIGSSLSIIASTLILITYSIFKELRTLPSKLLMNLAAAFLISDVLLISSSTISQNIRSVEFCSTVAIVFHFFLLGRFSWMNCLGIEYTRTFILALRLRRTAKSHTKLFVGYFAAGWGVPAFITGVTVIINYTVDGAVLYGTDVDGTQGFCWINEKISAIVAFVVPIFIATLLNICFFVIVTVIICIMACTSTKELRDQQRTVHVRVVLGIFSTLGLTWAFGFIALLSNLSWAWYPFIILNSNQAVLIAVGFLATKKIVLLYISFFTCKQDKDINSLSKAKSTKMESMGSLDKIIKET